MLNKNNLDKIKKFTKVQVRDYDDEDWKNAYFLGHKKETNEYLATICSEFTYRDTGVYDEVYAQCRIYKEL